MIIAKIEAELAISDQTPEELLTRFDGLIAPDGLSVTSIKGKKILNECLDLKFTKILEIDDEGEDIVFFNKEAELKYYPSNNKTFKVHDMIRINCKDDYSIVLTPTFALLFNGESQTTIEMENVKNINEMKLYLEQNYPNYIVLRKIT